MLYSFEDFTLDCNRRELRRGSDPIAVEPQVFDLLVYVIQHRDRVVSRDDLLAAVWRGRIVSESTLASRINAARQALGDDGDTQRLIKTIYRKGIRFVAEVSEDANAASSAPWPVSAQHVTFCRTDDGVHLAVGTSGDGPPIVKTANLAQSHRIRLAKPGLATVDRDIVGQVSADPLRRARQWPVRLGCR